MPEPGQSEVRGWPDDVGIIGMEVYFPSQYVDQSELEKFDGVSQGKYTIGLGQDKMGFCSDSEDVNSLCLTVVQRLMEKFQIPYTEIGRLEVGTESLLDKSKSVKTVLMQLFEESGNTNIEGVDTINACYGGTSALFNAINWVESSAWDGRYALVVAGDIAVYATGNARCTGGAGAVAMLIGPHAPVVFDRGCRSTHMQHVYDFYKPNMASEYPTVDGKLSIKCYLRAVDRCYESFSKKLQAAGHKSGQGVLDSVDAMLFHSPFCKLVQKSVARIKLNDYLRNPSPDNTDAHTHLHKYRNVNLEETYMDKDLEKACMAASNAEFMEKTKPSLLLANQVGNMYTPSLYGGLISFLISRPIEKLPGCRCVLFSYGSGLASSMFSLHISHDTPALQRLYNNLTDVTERLDRRKKIPPEEFAQIMKLRETTHHKAPYTPIGSTENLLPGSWFLAEIDSEHRRRYQRIPTQSDSIHAKQRMTDGVETKLVPTLVNGT